MNCSKTRLFSMLLLAIAATSFSPASAQIVRTDDLLTASRCDHVIGMMHRYGVNNSIDRSASYSMLHHGPFGAAVIPVGELGDLCIANISRVADDSPACGPKIAVDIKNHSIRDVCDFHVTAVAVLGRIFPTSPNVTAKVDKICAGQTVQIQLTLPLDALAMGNRNGQAIGFQRLVVAIDSHDVLMETNEANNLRAMDVTEIPWLTTAVTTEVSASEVGTVETGAGTVVQTNAVGTQAQAANVAPTATEATVATPPASSTNPESQGQAESTVPMTDLQSAIKQMGQSTVTAEKAASDTL
ncbi:hypothetical protein [Crateriforma conspicua]|uniref:CARDB domain-containing protein n=1 Tax=Crateriforma conspicua TaxID=2527996 RepID=A0A5C5Y8C9_9PLAN|nr:hypothetical protein [Crateriforma conspicua]TWT71218.1 hypothetical protein Pan14r_35280 [Crateriforma conspicua]